MEDLDWARRSKCDVFRPRGSLNRFVDGVAVLFRGLKIYQKNTGKDRKIQENTGKIQENTGKYRKM